MSVTPEPAPQSRRDTDMGRARRRARRRGEGQSLVEFALILTPLTVLVLGIIQLGLVFNAYVTVANATREGARSASIYVYDRTKTKSQNDTARSSAVISSVRTSMGFLPNGATNLADSEIVTSYSVPSGTTDTDARVGQHASVHVTYRLDMLIPLIAEILPRDANGRMRIDGQVTMVIN